MILFSFLSCFFLLLLLFEYNIFFCDFYFLSSLHSQNFRCCTLFYFNYYKFRVKIQQQQQPNKRQKKDGLTHTHKGINTQTHFNNKLQCCIQNGFFILVLLMLLLLLFCFGCTLFTTIDDEQRQRRRQQQQR